MTLPSSVTRLIKIFSILLLIGILFANSIIVLISIVPFLFVLIAFYLKRPSKIFVNRTHSMNVLHAGDSLQVNLDISIESGMGAVMLVDQLPSHFLVTEGSNFIVLWKGFGEKKVSLTYTVKCTTSGVYHLGNIKWEARHCLLNHAVQGEIRKELVLEVRPKLKEISMIRNSSLLSRIPMPLESVNKNGIPTLDFKEIRLYSYGDSFKYINWKATSRNIYQGELWPVVNEYDKEGKKAVWIFLDRSKVMEYGTNIRDAYECASEAVSELADFYLKEQCFVSLCTFGKENLFIYPGAGKKQLHKILKELIKLNTFKKSETKATFRRRLTLKETVRHHRIYFEGSKPLFVIVTRYEKRNVNELSSGVMEMIKYTTNSKGRFQVMVVNISGYELAAESECEVLASGILGARDNVSNIDLRKSCIWIDWNPVESSFSKALLRQVGK